MPAPGGPAPVRLASRSTAALCLGTVASYAAMYVTQPILPVLSSGFGVSPATAGLTVSAVVLAVAVGSFVHGPLSDSAGRKAVMVGSSVLLVIPTVACAVSRTFPELVALRGAQGLLIPGVTAVSVAWAGDHYARGDLRAAVGAIIAASVAGGLVGRVGSGLVAEHWGWRAPFLFSAALTLLGAAGMAAELPGDRGAPGAWRLAFAGMVRHLRDRRLAGGYLLAFWLFFGFIAVFTYLPYRLSGRPWGLSTDAVSSVYLVYLAGVVASPVAGRLAGRVAPERIMLFGLAVSAAGLAATLLPSLPWIVAGLGVMVVGTFAAQALGPSWVNEAAPSAKGGANALYLAFYYAGGTLGSFLPGLAWERWGWPGVAAASALALALAAASVAVLCRQPAGPAAGT